MSHDIVGPKSVRFKDISEIRFGSLTAKSYAGLSNTKRRRSLWKCLCDCGAEKITTGRLLVAGQCNSCDACLRLRLSATSTRHGGYNTPEYQCWANLIQRCYNTKIPDYPRYGGRGIRVCDRWLNSFEAFIADMGQRPPDKKSVDRFPDRSGNYEPGNCRWADPFEQAQNMRNNVEFELNGENPKCLSVLAREANKKRETVDSRLHRGWSIEEALSH